MNFEPIAYDPDEALKLENQICFPLYAAARKVIGAYTPLLKPLGITYTQYITFMILWENDGITVGEIGSRLHLDNGTLTPMLKKMEKEGFIERRRSLEDERKVDVFLTDSGREMKEKARNIPLEAGKCVNISPKDAKTLYNILYGIIDADKKEINAEGKTMNENREKIIIRTSVVGIMANVLLAAFKAVIGTITNSIAITMDAVNNLSDALSSVITIVGTKLAGKTPDKKHPLGYGRIEYLSAMIISVIVLYAGVTSFIESVKKIINPAEPDYSAVALIIIAVAVAVKILLGLYVRGKGRSVNSDSLVASGADALNDSIISASTLVAAAVYLIFGIRLEAWLGAVISAIIIKSGIDMLRETLSRILGERIDAETAHSVKTTICQSDGVMGAYDLILHNYGPDRQIGSVHIEVSETMTAKELDALERKITVDVYKEHKILLTGISVYSVNTSDETAANTELKVRKITDSYPEVLQTHGFFLDKENKRMTFDVIISYDAPNRNELYEEIMKRVKEAFPEYDVHIQLDFDISD